MESRHRKGRKREEKGEPSQEREKTGGKWGIATGKGGNGRWGRELWSKGKEKWGIGRGGGGLKSFFEKMAGNVAPCHGMSRLPCDIVTIRKAGEEPEPRGRVPPFGSGREGETVVCCRNGKCIYNPKWMTGVNFCVLPSCPFAGGKQRRKEEKKRRV